MTGCCRGLNSNSSTAFECYITRKQRFSLFIRCIKRFLGQKDKTWCHTAPFSRLLLTCVGFYRGGTLSETQWNQHDSQSTHEDPEDDDHHCGIICGVLDAVLSAWHLVLVPASYAAVDARIHPPCSLRLRQPQHVLRSGHLWFLHALVPSGHSQLLLQKESKLFSQITGPTLRKERGCKQRSRVGPRKQWPAQRTTSIEGQDTSMS